MLVGRVAGLASQDDTLWLPKVLKRGVSGAKLRGKGSTLGLTKLLEAKSHP